jgi:hypothetical protein
MQSAESVTSWKQFSRTGTESVLQGEIDMDPGYSRRKISPTPSRLVIDGRKNWVLGAWITQAPLR